MAAHTMSNYTLRLDTQLKADAQELFDYLGIDMATAIKLFLRQSVQYQAIPFPIERRLPNASTMQAIDNAVDGKNLSKPFDSVEDLMEDLDA